MRRSNDPTSINGECVFGCGGVFVGCVGVGEREGVCVFVGERM